MGYDISYHPVTETEMHEWYFGLNFSDIARTDFSAINAIAEKYGIEDFYRQKYIEILEVALNTKPEDAFELSHGYYMAVVQGLFRKYFYTRGSAFSFLIQEHPHFRSYTKPWQEILSRTYPNTIYNSLHGNYSSGVYIPADKAAQLLNDYQTNTSVRQALDNFYSHKRIHVFIDALQTAVQNKQGLLEATEVIEPNPLDLENTVCYSNLFNCDMAGAYLYREAAMEQLREIEQREKLPEGEIARNATYNVTNVGPVDSKKKEEKKGFFKRLFGG